MEALVTAGWEESATWNPVERPDHQAVLTAMVATVPAA